MKKCLLIIIIPFVTILAKDIKIGLVDSPTVFEKYQATAAADIEFNEYVEMFRDSTAALRQDIEKLNSELEAQKLVLSEEARLRKLDEIETLENKYDQLLQDVFGQGGKIDQKNEELIAPLLKKINEAVAKIAEQEGFQIILDLSEGIFYASSELEITSMVIDELNLEYGPTVLPTGEIRKVIGIFPFREQNPEAVDADLGQRCQNELYKALMTFTQQFKITSKTEINLEIVRRNLGTNVEDSDALKIGLMKLCDYIIIGDVSKYATRIEYTIVLHDVNENQEIMKRSNSVTEDIKLFEALNNDLRALLDKIEQ